MYLVSPTLPSCCLYTIEYGFNETAAILSSCLGAASGHTDPETPEAFGGIAPSILLCSRNMCPAAALGLAKMFFSPQEYLLPSENHLSLPLAIARLLLWSNRRL